MLFMLFSDQLNLSQFFSENSLPCVLGNPVLQLHPSLLNLSSMVNQKITILLAKKCWHLEAILSVVCVFLSIFFLTLRNGCIYLQKTCVCIPVPLCHSFGLTLGRYIFSFVYFFIYILFDICCTGVIPKTESMLNISNRDTRTFVNFT